MEKEAEERITVQAKNLDATGVYYPYLNVSNSQQQWCEVLTVSYRYDLINNGDRDMWGYCPEIQILRKEGHKWVQVTPLELKDNSGRTVAKGIRTYGLAAWQPSRYSILARDSMLGEFQVSILNFAKFAHQPLRLRVKIDIGGQPPANVETDLAVKDA
jgi:hypothetical protein